MNYTGSATNTLVVAPQAISVTADAKSKTYGENDPALTYQFTPSLVGGDSFIGALSRETGEAVGTYAITQGTLALSANYTLSFTGANFTINSDVPSSPTGLAASPGDGEADLTWIAVSGATSYTVKRSLTSGSGYTIVASILVATAHTDTGLTNGTTYYYVVSASNSHGEGPNSAEVSATPATSLPSPWQTADIGSVGVPGSAVFTNGTFTVEGSGDDIWNSADAFRYVHQLASGDCTMVARVLTVENTHSWAKAGVMVRETTAAGSVCASVLVTPGNGITFQWRTVTGGASANAVKTGLTAPYWVRLTRTGNSFTAHYSSNGSSWKQLGTAQTITMSTSATMGLAVTSHNNGTLCTATMSNITATP
jgi:regulation of enolase protein 1 (concanavalin A-like superfamily)